MTTATQDVVAGATNQLPARTFEIDAVIREDAVTNKVVVIANSHEYSQELARFGLTFDSSEADVIQAIAPGIREESQVDISRGYKVQKATNTRTIFVIPNSTAG